MSKKDKDLELEFEVGGEWNEDEDIIEEDMVMMSQETWEESEVDLMINNGALGIMFAYHRGERDSMCTCASCIVEFLAKDDGGIQ
jgi:hypothetical protein